MTLADSLKPKRRDEKRRDSRAFLTVAVTLVIQDEIIRGTECRNISSSGMLITVDNEIEVGKKGTVTLTKRCDDRFLTFSAECQVTRFEKLENGPCIGVTFTSMSPHDTESLAQIVDYHVCLMYREKILFDESKIKGITLKIADTKDEFEQAFRLLHDMYVNQGFMHPHPSGMRISLHNAAPFTIVIVAKIKDKVILTTSLYVDSFLGIPADSTFREEIGTLRAQGRYFGEVGSLAAHPDSRSTDATLQLHMQKMILLYSINYLKLDDLIITVICKHQSYYRHILLLQTIGEAKCYSSANDTPVIPMRLSLENVQQRYSNAYKFFPPERKLDDFIFHKQSDCILLPSEKKPVQIWNKDLVDYFLRQKTNILEESDPKKVVRILGYYT